MIASVRGKGQVNGRPSSPQARAVNDVVLDQRERVHHLDRRGRVGEPQVGLPTRRPVAPFNKPRT